MKLRLKEFVFLVLMMEKRFRSVVDLYFLKSIKTPRQGPFYTNKIVE